MEPFRYTKAPRSRSLRPLAFPDLLGKVQDGQNHPQTRKKKEKVMVGFMNLGRRGLADDQ